MFSLYRPAAATIQSQLDAAKVLPVSYSPTFLTRSGIEPAQVPRGFVRDHTRSEIGQGAAAFAAAKSAFRQWAQFDLGWVRIANPGATVEAGQVIALEAQTLGIWTLILSRILYVIDEPDRFGFGYGTTPLHVERGEERFLLEYDAAAGAVHYDLQAISQPAHLLTRLGYPYTRSCQHRFARDSHAHMRRLLADLETGATPRSDN